MFRLIGWPLFKMLINIISSGIVTTLAGTNIYFYFQDGFGTSAGLYFPRGLASLPNGDILIADRLNDRIRLLKGAQ